MAKILNLTQHPATADQIQAGVFDLQGNDKDVLVDLLTFDSIPSGLEIKEVADMLCQVTNCNHSRGEAVMIGGAPFLMPALEAHLTLIGFKPCYAFSKRESSEVAQPDGSIRKVNVFKHIGFVYPEA